MNVMNQMANYYLSNKMQTTFQELEKKLQQANPQMYQMYQMARQQNANPKDLFSQITKDYDENTMKQFKEQAKQFGIDENLLNQLSM